MERLLVLLSNLPHIFLVVKKQPFVLSFFTTREKRFQAEPDFLDLTMPLRIW
jgi:hypothetical protein